MDGSPEKSNVTRFYFDGESRPRIEVPLRELFSGKTQPFGPEFSYVSGTGGNLYYPLPYATSLKITIEEKEKPLYLYYEIDHHIYPKGTAVETTDTRDAGSDVQAPGVHLDLAEVHVLGAASINRDVTADIGLR